MVSLPGLDRFVLAARSGVYPVDPPRAHASGPAPYRLLAIGGDILAGAGVATHDLALTGCLARAVAGLVGHGVDVESIVSDVSPSRFEQEVRGVALGRYDAVLLFVRLGDERRGGDGADAPFGRMIRRVRARMAPDSPLIVIGAPRSLRAVVASSAPAEQMDVLRALSQPCATTLLLRADLPVAMSTVERSAVWASQIAAVITARLREPIVLTAPAEELHESARRNALEALGNVGEARRQALKRVASFASAAYGTEFAAVAIAGDSLMHFVVRRGAGPDSIPRGETICETVLRSFGGVIVGDAQTDSRFSGLPVSRSGSARFYAGHRIEAADGTPIGVLCVWDTDPRPVLLQNLDVLRDFAHGAEQKLRLDVGAADLRHWSGRRPSGLKRLA